MVCDSSGGDCTSIWHATFKGHFFDLRETRFGNYVCSSLSPSIIIIIIIIINYYYYYYYYYYCVMRIVSPPLQKIYSNYQYFILLIVQFQKPP